MLSDNRSRRLGPAFCWEGYLVNRFVAKEIFLLKLEIISLTLSPLPLKCRRLSRSATLKRHSRHCYCSGKVMYFC